MNGEEIFSYKKGTISTVWDKICEIETDVQYSSLVCELLAEERSVIIYRILASLAVIPPLMDAADRWFHFDCNWPFFVVDALFIILPILFGIKAKDFLKKYFVYGFNERDALLNLNLYLCTYKEDLLLLLTEIACSNSKKAIDICKGKYTELESKNRQFINEHDKLTGHINEILKEEAISRASARLEQIRDALSANWNSEE